MPKIGMEPIRRDQLMSATIESIAEFGMHATTISRISQRAGLSSGIISHYFGSKQGLINASVRYMLARLKQEFLSKIDGHCSAEQRLMYIVETNFSGLQHSAAFTKTWLSFWAQSMHNTQLQRLQKVNDRRLISNLSYAFALLMPRKDAKQAALLSAAMIDGLWLRSVLSQSGPIAFKQSEALAKTYINSLIKQYGDSK
ncbi:transcriptional regulator BetI [Alginatibacterium sediminis]|uniref:HTH-type transcriptional regulator BetI n=1 Tax=Alginatibacterium sediminis TaxID=2164068 RepID=A0A420EDJ3_9ALTE|nr:transcriptional regulator BetI [Alginatibacterium sediminis]RKF18741.1 transcriptional regulator BetI [Alginatibacterium sediminis]